MVRFRLSFTFLMVAALGCAATASDAQTRRQQPTAAASRQPAPAQKPGGTPPEMRIAAVVNDQVISLFDLASRVRTVLISSNLPDSEEIRQKLASQVLRSLIDEKLQLQEAKRQSVTATEAEINTALQQIEKQNNMKAGQLDQFLQARGVDRGQLVEQLTASIVWAKLVRRLAAQST
jgi:peptidyl-prolyl cis-trans isomerase SurA